jgi:hypothetical protein
VGFLFTNDQLCKYFIVVLYGFFTFTPAAIVVTVVAVATASAVTAIVTMVLYLM